jgi:hypothetical protein
MTQIDFEAMVNNTSFDAATKALFITSYEMGFMQGRLEQMYNVIDRMDLITAERQMEFATKQ